MSDETDNRGCGGRRAPNGTLEGSLKNTYIRVVGENRDPNQKCSAIVTLRTPDRPRFSQARGSRTAM